MSNKFKTTYSIKKNNVDICKIIFTKAKDIEGKFDIKIGFYDEKYRIKVHKLFRYHNENVIRDELQDKQISYHYGRSGTVKVQLRNIKKDELSDAIVFNLVPPNDYSLFPIPLFKIEVNSNYKEPLSIINSNRKRHEGIIIDLGKNNVAEIYMSSPNDLNEMTFEKYEYGHILESLVPIEYFASNGGHVGFEKNRFYYDEDGSHLITKEIQATDLNLIFDSYYNPNLDRKPIEPCITFIENELYEEILLNTYLQYNVLPNGGHNGGYMASSKHLLDINSKKLVKDTISERIWKNLDDKEKKEFYKRAIDSRRILYNKLTLFEKECEKIKVEILKRIGVFLDAILKLNKYYSDLYSNDKLGNNIADEILWMIIYPSLKIEDMCILFGKYLGIDNFIIFKSLITYEEKPKENTCDTGNKFVYRIKDIRKVDFEYCYFEYDSTFNIHIGCQFINQFLTEGNSIPFISRGEDFANELRKWNIISKDLSSKNYLTSPLEYRIISMDEELNKRDGLLHKVYDMILKTINTNEK